MICHIQILSAKRVKLSPGFLRPSVIGYGMNRTLLYPAFFPLAIWIFPATEILSFLFDKHELIGLNQLVKSSILNNLYNKTGQNVTLKTFLIPKHTTVVDIFR